MQNIGEKLEEARKRQGISIREAAEATKVRSDFLLNLENNNFDFNLPEVYRQGFLKLYARYLKLDAEKILTDYNALRLSATATQSPGRTHAPFSRHPRLGHGHREREREGYGAMDKPEKGKGATSTAAAAPQPGHTGEGAAGAEGETQDFGEGSEGGQDWSVYWKAGIAGLLAILVIVLIVLLFRAVVGGGEAGAPGQQQLEASEQAASPGGGEEGATASQPLTIVGRGPAQVRVSPAGGGADLMVSAVERGDRRTVNITDEVLIIADPLENISIEWDGRTYRAPQGFSGRGQMRFPR